MIITCRYSGVKFGAHGFGTLKVKDGQHPIMDVSVPHLIFNARKWTKNELDQTELRLLFIAFLKATDHVDFTCPAYPSHALIQRYMEPIVQTITWMYNAPDSMPLPTYVIRPENKELTNIGSWINGLKEARDDWGRQGAVYAFRQKMMLREAKLMRLIRSATKNLPAYYNQLAEWALDASEAPAEKRFEWKSYFQLRDPLAIWQQESSKIEVLLLHLQAGESFIDTNTILGAAAINHIMRVYTICKQGPRGSIMDDEPYSWNDVRAGTFTILGDSNLEHENRVAAAALAPKSKPVQDDYDNIVAYYKDIARWRMAQSLESEKANFLASQKRLDIEAVKDQTGDLDPDDDDEDLSSYTDDTDTGDHDNE